jgi:nitrogen fixation protein FixH
MNPPTKNYWPLGLFVTFGLFFAGMATVVGIASTHREDLVNQNYYDQELKYQDQIDAAGRAQAAGATVEYLPAAGQVRLILPVAQLARQFSGTVTLYRANNPALDRELPLAPRADGTQSIDAAQLVPGPWQLRAAWTASGQGYFLDKKFVVTAR